MWQFWKLFYDANTGILEWSFKIGYRADIGFTLVAKIFIPAGTVVGFYGGYVVDDDYTVSTYDFSLSDKIRLYLNFYDHKMSVVFGKKKQTNFQDHVIVEFGQKIFGVCVFLPVWSFRLFSIFTP